ncbi:putative glycosyltransferase [Bacillus sp. TS-2]|nr:putative glycosyltransferase [Bacillus sp. TS-2]
MIRQINQSTHFIIAPSPWFDDPIKYRRHRLAEFLLANHNQVIWVAPFSNSDKNNIPAVTKLKNGIIQIIVHDFKSLHKHLHTLQKKS